MYSTDIENSIPLISNDGIPVPIRDTRKPIEKHLAVYFILVSTLLERIAFYSLAANLVLSLNSNQVFNWKEANASIATLIFTGTSYISTIIFAIISDAKLGRAKTTIIGFAIYLIGYTIALYVSKTKLYEGTCRNNTATEDDYINPNTIFKESCADWILATIILIAIGVGAVQSNMIVFGAEQLQHLNVKSRYFDKYIVVVNLAAIISKLIIANIQDQQKHYLICYLIVTSLLLCAALLFVLGWRFYWHTNLHETVVSNFFPVFFNAFQTWLKYRKYKRMEANQNSSLTNSISTNGNLIEETEDDTSIRFVRRPSVFIDFAKVINNGKYQDRIVDDVKSLRKAFFVYGLLIPYWLIYNQLDSTLLNQRQHMHISQSSSSSSTHPLIITSISFGDPITIIVGIIILNLFVYKYVEKHNLSMTIPVKLVIGMIFAAISMCTAGGIELVRQYECPSNNDSEISNLSIYYQLPSNILMGFSELFLMVASFEFAYYASPRSAQTLFMSLRFFSLGVSSFLGSLFIYIYPRTDVYLDFTCYKNSKYNWSFYTYFFILAGFQIVFMVVFIICQRKFHVIKLNRQQIQTNQFIRSFSSYTSL